MSRIGKKPIELPKNVEFTVENGAVKVKGPKGEMVFKIPEYIEISNKDNLIHLSISKSCPKKHLNKARALWGTSRAILNNMVKGVTEGFQKQLQMEGIGYKAEMKGNTLVLNVGFSHPVEIVPFEGVQFSVEKNIITVSGIDKEKVGQAAALIRKIRKPEPYKGKGIRYVGEQIRRKLGKKAVGAGG